MRLLPPLVTHCTEHTPSSMRQRAKAAVASKQPPPSCPPAFPLLLQIVALGVDTYLKMLLEDNFVHTDLHPGNILVRPVGGGTMHHAGDPDPAAAGAAEAAAAAAGAVLAAAGAVAEEAGVEIVAPVRERHQPQPLQLVLLDFGLAEELTPPVRFHFISFLHYIAKGG